MRILRSADYKRMPWKNGGGETVEIAISPEGAGLADFDWRISMATVAADGPFSAFAGIDRTLSILDGDGMTLYIEGREPVCMTRQSAPLSFPADIPTRATLVDGAITDLNIMTRRSAMSHAVERMTIAGEAAVAMDGAITVILCGDGQIDVGAGSGRFTLAARDCLLSDATAGTLTLAGTATLFVIRLRHL